MNIQGITVPKAPIKPYSMSIHEDIRVDNYYWLNDRENTEVIAYLEQILNNINQYITGQDYLDRSQINDR